MAQITISVTGSQGSGKTLVQDRLIDLIRREGWKLVEITSEPATVTIEPDVGQLLMSSNINSVKD